MANDKPEGIVADAKLDAVDLDSTVPKAVPVITDTDRLIAAAKLHINDCRILLGKIERAPFYSEVVSRLADSANLTQQFLAEFEARRDQ